MKQDELERHDEYLRLVARKTWRAMLEALNFRLSAAHRLTDSLRALQRKCDYPKHTQAIEAAISSLFKEIKDLEDETEKLRRLISHSGGSNSGAE